jgi:hypothetical protein
MISPDRTETRTFSPSIFFQLVLVGSLCFGERILLSSEEDRPVNGINECYIGVVDGSVLCEDASFLLRGRCNMLLDLRGDDSLVSAGWNYDLGPSEDLLTKLT